MTWDFPKRPRAVMGGCEGAPMTNETMEARFDRLEAMLVGLVDQVERLKDQVVVPLCLQERTLRRLEQAVDELRATPLQLPPPPRLENPAEDGRYS